MSLLKLNSKLEYERNLHRDIPLLPKLPLEATTSPKLEATASSQAFSQASSQSIASLKQHFLSSVTSVNIETTSWCNINCSFCPSSFLARKHHLMSEEMFANIVTQLHELQYTKKIKLHQSNEPLTDQNLGSCIRQIRKALPQVPIGFYTNGTLLTEDLLITLHSVGLNFMLVGSTSQTVRTNVLRISNYIKRFYNNVNVFVETKDMHLTQTGYTESVYNTLSIGIRDTSKQPLTSRCNITSNAYLDYSCSKPFKHVEINYDGTIQLCCEEWLRAGDSIVGALKKNTLLEIWYGSVIQEYRDMLSRNERTKYPCNQCDFVE